jgi:hypothetical protein
MPSEKVDLAVSVLDELVRARAIASWSRHIVASAGRTRRSVADIYEVRVEPALGEEDRAALRDLLERYGRTSLTHEIEIRFMCIGSAA